MNKQKSIIDQRAQEEDDRNHLDDGDTEPSMRKQRFQGCILVRDRPIFHADGARKAWGLGILMCRGWQVTQDNLRVFNPAAVGDVAPWSLAACVADNDCLFGVR